MELISPDHLDCQYRNPDPWKFETRPIDNLRRAILLSVIPKRGYEAALDIGCGNGFVSGRLPGKRVMGVDVSKNAIKWASEKHPKVDFRTASVFDLEGLGKFDLIVATGVLYPQYIGDSAGLIYLIMDDLLEPGGILVSCHIDEWYTLRFPYTTIHREYYPYREYTHLLEVYQK